MSNDAVGAELLRKESRHPASPEAASSSVTSSNASERFLCSRKTTRARHPSTIRLRAQCQNENRVAWRLPLSRSSALQPNASLILPSAVAMRLA